jgi:hypothetical protein
MRIARGLKQSYKNAKEMTVAEVKRDLTLSTNCYEVLNEGFNRMYLDIDGTAPETATQAEFDALRQETLTKIDEIASGREIAVMESSRFESKKVSFRVVFPKVKTTKKDNKAIVLSLGKLVTMPTGVRIDPAPYGQNQKMRMLGQNKDGENRPLVLVRGEVERIEPQGHAERRSVAHRFSRCRLRPHSAFYRPRRSSASTLAANS